MISIKILNNNYYNKIMDSVEFYVDDNISKTVKENIDRISQMTQVQKEGLELFKKKNSDYGDAFANYGVIGVLVRMGDKIQRLQNITKKNITLVDDEKIRDTLIDLHNYSAMAIMLLDENKEKLNLQ